MDREGLRAAGRDADGQIEELGRQLRDVIESAQSSNVDDEHDPEGATIAFERAQVAALLAGAQKRRAELDQAVARLDAGAYGTCERCGDPIPAERLAALPAARTCVTCTATRER